MDTVNTMIRPRPTRLYHFTHIDHLPTIATKGLFADTFVATEGLLTTEISQRSIKSQRRRRQVPCDAGGVVADYAPFYLAPRSPMLSAIFYNRVPEYSGGQEPLIYLVSTVEKMTDLGLELVFTDRNAALHITRFTSDADELEATINWVSPSPAQLVGVDSCITQNPGQSATLEFAVQGDDEQLRPIGVTETHVASPLTDRDPAEPLQDGDELFARDNREPPAQTGSGRDADDAHRCPRSDHVVVRHPPVAQSVHDDSVSS